jgi:hypothetical protein
MASPVPVFPLVSSTTVCPGGFGVFDDLPRDPVFF